MVLVAATSLVIAAFFVFTPDARVDSSASTSKARSPDVTLDGTWAGAVYQDRRVSVEYALWFNRSNDHGATWGASDTRLNTDFTAGAIDSSVSRAIIDSAGDNYLFVLFLIDFGDKNAYATVSADGGATWAANQTKISQDILGALEEENHHLDVVPGGKAFVVWNDGREGSGIPGSPLQIVWMRRTLNGGSTWLAEQGVNDIDLDMGTPTPQNEQSDQPEVCADGTGNAYVVWRDRRRTTDPTWAPSDPGRIVIKSSADDGQTLGSETRLDTGDGLPGTESREPAIDCRNDGLVAVVYEDERDGSSDVNLYLNVSTNAGGTWQASDIRVDGGSPVGANATKPKIRIGPGSPARIYVAWEDDRDGSPDLYLAVSADGGTTWGAAQRMNTGTTAGTVTFESWDMDADGSLVAVTWTDARNGSFNDVFSNRSIDGGQTFSGAIRLDTATPAGASDSIQVGLSVGNDGYLAVYSDFRNNATNADIFVGGEQDDDDDDGVADEFDNCVMAFNPGQEDRDFDGAGDACDAFADDPLDDVDGDGSSADVDNCDDVANASQTDIDADGFGDACDLCNGTTDKVQRDLDGDGTGDLCDNDVDGDGTDNASDGDDDDDGILDASDNCDFVPNAKQEDEDSDGTGDACDDDDLIVSGVLVSPITANDRIDWDEEMPAQSYDVYFGRAEQLASADPGFCYRPDQLNTFTLAPEDPRLGEAYWYLVTAFDGVTEGSPGIRNGAGQRPLPSSCNLTAADDWDGDGSRNLMDNCPLDANASQADGDGDTVGDACDDCPSDPNKFQVGVCGCGVLDSDADGDGFPDCIDTCANDPNKKDPGVCGCGIVEDLGDDDSDTIMNCFDNCIDVSNMTQDDLDADGSGDVCDTCTDTDADGLGNPGFPLNSCADDNCPSNFNPGQQDLDGDGSGNPCDDDTDGDGTGNATDDDDDNDGFLDGFDDCPFDHDPGQLDHDLDGTGNECDFEDLEIWGVRVIPGAPDTLTWYPEIDATDYNVYSASVTTIVVGMPYGTCLVPNTASLSASIPGDPVTGDALFYLVTGTFFTFEGTAGFDTVDNERLVSGCP